MATRVTMNEAGRITLPAAIRRLMRLEPNQELEVGVSEDGETLYLRPMVTIPREDAWAYTPEHREAIRRAREDIAAGRLRQMSEEEILAVMESAAE
jgi:AbrB family looped-hinge helix DNA binding protein